MRNVRFGTIVTAVLFCAGFIFAPLLTTPAHAYDEAATKVLYDKKCAKCHGETGKGDGRKAKTLKKKPRDYTDQEKMGELTDADLVESIKEGKKPMPSYKKGRKMLTDEQINDLVTYIRAFTQ